MSTPGSSDTEMMATLLVVEVPPPNPSIWRGSGDPITSRSTLLAVARSLGKWSLRKNVPRDVPPRMKKHGIILCPMAPQIPKPLLLLLLLNLSYLTSALPQAGCCNHKVRRRTTTTTTTTTWEHVNIKHGSNFNLYPIQVCSNLDVPVHYSCPTGDCGCHSSSPRPISRQVAQQAVTLSLNFSKALHAKIRDSNRLRRRSAASSASWLEDGPCTLILICGHF